MSPPFLQSREWGEFQKTQGRDIWHIEGGGWHALLLRVDLPLNMNYLYCGGGPDLDFTDKGALKEFLKKVDRIAKEERSTFLKIEPMISGEFSKQLTDAGFRKSRKAIQPQQTTMLDLTLSEKKLLSATHKKTRYNIGLAKKHRVSVYPSSRIEDQEIFIDLLDKTSARDRFTPHSKGYYRDLLRQPFTQLFLAERDGVVMAANIVLFWEGGAVYLHGASDYTKRSYMAPYLLQWETILEAKKRGYKTYDFWGTDKKKWPGVTRFKQGFGGADIEYIGSYDYMYNRFLYAGYMLKQKLPL